VRTCINCKNCQEFVKVLARLAEIFEDFAAEELYLPRHAHGHHEPGKAFDPSAEVCLDRAQIVLGASLLTLFLNTTAIFQLGFVTIFIAHVMFIVSFVVVTVKARLIGFDRHLEEAAMDLGANEVTTFRKVTLPLIAPAMLAAALLGFALSIDDFVITYFNAGGTQTFPIFVWGIARVAVPPQVNVIASAIFVVAIALALGNVFSQYRSAKRTRGAT